MTETKLKSSATGVALGVTAVFAVVVGGALFVATTGSAPTSPQADLAKSAPGAKEDPSGTATATDAVQARSEADLAAAATNATTETPAADSRRYTKAEFQAHVVNKTKAEIRAEFGPPSVVHDDRDEWYYPNLPIYDAEAGIQTVAFIRFAGIDGPDDFVAQVTY